MAEAAEVIELDSDEEKNIDCPICLQTASFPTRLPCGHIFCFLCVKGVANQNRRCPLCRKDIPIECLQHPELVRGTQDLKNTNTNDFKWFYEGRNGWWQYDERTSQDIEEAYQKKENTVILVAGHLYMVDFEGMTQLRSDDNSRRRRVKRDLGSVPKKGVAGLRLDSNNIVVTDMTPTTSSEATADIPLTPASTNPNADSTTAEALRIATHIIDSTLAHSDDHSSDETGRDISQEIFDDSSDLLEGIRSLTLRNIVQDSDSNDSENENLF